MKFKIPLLVTDFFQKINPQTDLIDQLFFANNSSFNVRKFSSPKNLVLKPYLLCHSGITVKACAEFKVFDKKITLRDPYKKS